MKDVIFYVETILGLIFILAIICINIAINKLFRPRELTDGKYNERESGSD